MDGKALLQEGRGLLEVAGVQQVVDEVGRDLDQLARVVTAVREDRGAQEAQHVRLARRHGARLAGEGQCLTGVGVQLGGVEQEVCCHPGLARVAQQGRHAAEHVGAALTRTLLQHAQEQQGPLGMTLLQAHAGKGHQVCFRQVRDEPELGQVACDLCDLEQCEEASLAQLAPGLFAVDRTQHLAVHLVGLERLGDPGLDRDLVDGADRVEQALPLVGPTRHLEQQCIDLELRRAVDQVAQRAVLDVSLEELEGPVVPGEESEQLLMDLVRDHGLDEVVGDMTRAHQQLPERQRFPALVQQCLAQALGLDGPDLNQPLASLRLMMRLGTRIRTFPLRK